MITHSHCMRFIGQPVFARTTTGVTHYGILHSVTGDGIYMRPFGGGVPGLVHETNVKAKTVDLLQNMPQPTDDVKEVFGFAPFFFLPFLALAALGPWGWW